jgi:xanthine dehydrogenase small subunit
MIQFLLNNEVVRIEDGRADLTVLEYLRERRQLCGTKEGCASGDCGACTVVLGIPGNGKMDYINCNSCILFLGSMHGKQLITVEHLKTEEFLHPAQQTMVDHHGSQCGFCTPGFVMSLFALYKNSSPGQSVIDRKKATEEFMGGNLCRCTGYKPIIEAAIESTREPCPDQFTKLESRARQILEDPEIFNNCGTDNYHLPASCKELAELLDLQPGARLLAGGTDLALEVTQQLKSLDNLIYLGNVSELRDIVKSTDNYEIGAAVSLNDFNNLIKNDYPELSELMLRFGSRQIRNLGTVGGNIANASPIGDLPPVFIALDAELVLQSVKGKRRVKIEDYFVDYRQTVLHENEFVRSIQFPRADSDHQLKIYKISKRIDDDISAVCIAFYIRLDNGIVNSIRIACGGMAAIPKRARECEIALIGNPLDETTVSAAQQALELDFQPIDDVRASAGYRMQVTRNLLTRLQIELTEPSINTSVMGHG